jgi:hypothetical protein
LGNAIELSQKDLQEIARKNPELTTTYPELAEFITPDLPQKTQVIKRQKPQIIKPVLNKDFDKDFVECLLELGFNNGQISKMSLSKMRMIIYGSIVNA